MKKEEFKYEDKERYITKAYVFECEDYLLEIYENYFDNDTIQYSNEICSKYIEKKDQILNHILDVRLRKWYEQFDYTDEYIKLNIGRAQIKILDTKKHNPSLNCNYIGVIAFLESELDGHIIEVEFTDDLILKNKVSING